MDQHIGPDVSLKDTSISVRENGKRVWRGKCPSDPKLLAELIRKRAPHAKRVVFETGPLSVWFYHALTAEGLPAICIDARHAKAALDMAANKTDANACRDCAGSEGLRSMEDHASLSRGSGAELLRTSPIWPRPCGSDLSGLKIAENAKLDLAKSIKLKLDVGLRMCHKAKHGYAF